MDNEQRRAKYREKMRLYRARHAEQWRTWRREYDARRRADAERHAAELKLRRERYAAGRDRRQPLQREYNRARYAKDPAGRREYNRRWRANNPERARASVRLTRLRRRAAVGDERVTINEWLSLLERYGYCCAYCGAAGPLEADHRDPLARGGRNTIENLLPACVRCNRRKHTKTEDEFREFLAGHEDITETAIPYRLSA
jgi:5-methylcytosine-specific restriction endonuclease McrA